MRAYPSSCNQKKYYWYHQNHGHNTENYIQLKDEIEALIQRGYLGKFVQNDKSNPQLVSLCSPKQREIYLTNQLSG